MRINMRQGVVSHQSGGFLQVNPSLNVNLFATNRPVAVTVAHHDTDYLHSEDAPITDAWVGPFSPTENYWLYWDFNLSSFERTFGFTKLEPVAQSIPPGGGGVDILQAIPGVNNQGQFVVDGHYVVTPQRPIAVALSTGNDGIYTVVSAVYNSVLGETTLFVAEDVVDATPDGQVSLDLDIAGNPLLTEGRMWYDTNNHIQYELRSGVWAEVLRVFAAQLTLGNVFLSMSIDGAAGTFTGTKIGDTSSTLTGRVLFTENSKVIQRDNRTFLTTEDQFFTNQSRVDAIRLESNVSRAQNTESALAQFTVVTWVDDDKIVTTQYDDTGESVVGMLTENLLFGEVGAIIIQGSIINPTWNWTTGAGAVPVGSPLWVNNGLLVAVDPHVSDVLNFPTGRVPVARVLGNDSIIFEQGLGGKGDTGPAGSIEYLPPATTSVIGGVTFVTPSSDPLFAFAISDTDPRLFDARTPLTHLHTATEVVFTPAGGITSNTVQLALEEVGLTKLNISGGTLSGPLILSSNPTTGLQATTKQYVDGLVSGLVWLDPVCLINMISDVETIPPVTPVISDAYIVAPGAVGDWSAIPSGHVVVWDGTVWLDRGAVTDVNPVAARFGIAFKTNTTPGGSFVGQKNNIALYDNTGTLTGFEIPTQNNAVFVCNVSSLHAFNQFAFSGTDWVLFGSAQAITADGITTTLGTNVLSVKQFADGGINDVKFWQGLEPADLALAYSPLSHTHIGTQVALTPYITSPDWGTLSSPPTAQLISTEVQGAVNELMDKKAAKRPTYATLIDAPAAGTVEGMIIHVRDESLMYYPDSGSWSPLAINGADLSIPYDIAFSASGILQQNVVIGSFVSPRTIDVDALAPGSVAYADSTATSTYTLKLFKVVSGVPTEVGTVTFNIGSNIGVIVIGSAFTLVPGNVLQLKTDPVAVPDPSLKDIAITIIGCSITQQCT